MELSVNPLHNSLKAIGEKEPRHWITLKTGVWRTIYLPPTSHDHDDHYDDDSNEEGAPNGRNDDDHHFTQSNSAGFSCLGGGGKSRKRDIQ